jgi:multiple sugar transport system permease protein
LEESALIDGASWFRAFWSITFPLSTPGLVTAFILCFIFTWNEFLFALILTFQKAGTVPLLLASQVTNTGVQWWRLSVLALMSIIPSIICALVLERYIVKGLFTGGIK